MLRTLEIRFNALFKDLINLMKTTTLFRSVSLALLTLLGSVMMSRGASTATSITILSYGVNAAGRHAQNSTVSNVTGNVNLGLSVFGDLAEDGRLSAGTGLKLLDAGAQLFGQGDTATGQALSAAAGLAGAIDNIADPIYQFENFFLNGNPTASFNDVANASIQFASAFQGFTESILGEGGLKNITPSFLTTEGKVYYNGFELQFQDMGQSRVGVVVGYDQGLKPGFGGYNGVATIPDYVITPSKSVVPVVRIVSLSSATNIFSLRFGSHVFFIDPHALDIVSATNITGAGRNFQSEDGVLFNFDQTLLIRYPIAKGGNYVVPSTVKAIAANAFYKCRNLGHVVIGTNVVKIGANAFANSSLGTVYFAGNAPVIHETAFSGITPALWYLPGTTGWKGTNYGGRPAWRYAPFRYTTSNGAATITQFDVNGGTHISTWNNPASEAVIIPDEMGGYPVTSIAPGAFEDNWGLTNVIVLDSVTSIGADAFYNCANLKSIRLSRNLTSLGEAAFAACTNLSTLVVPSEVTAIPISLVHGCLNLGTFRLLGTKVTSIGALAFANCPRLFYVNIPASVTSIGENAFDYCTSVAIAVDPQNQYYSTDRYYSGLLNKAQTELYHAYAKANGSYEMPNTVQIIKDRAFYGASLATITVPAGVTSIGDEAFGQNTYLKGVYFAGNAPHYEAGIFSGSPNVTVYVAPGTSGWGANFDGRPVRPWVTFGYATNNGSLTMTSYTGPGGRVVVPETIGGLPVTGIQAGTFANPGAISSLQLPNSVTHIADGAFSGLINLTNIVFGNSVASIGQNAFAGCASLENLVIPNTVKTMGSGAFQNCGLTNVVIGSGLTNLADNLFSGCKLLTVTVPMNIKRIGASTFANNAFLESVIIPSSVTSLGANAFAYCRSLYNAYFQGDAPASDDTTFIGNNYYGYTWASSVTVVQYLPNTRGWGLRYGGAEARLLPLYYSISGGKVTITECTASGRFSIFSTINGLPVGGIGDFAFANCGDLTAVVIPAGITSIGTAPFMNCIRLTNLVVAPGNPAYVSVGNVLFNSSQTVLKQFPAGYGGSYIVPATVTNIGAGSFQNSGLQQVSIPAGVTAIGEQAFAFCGRLTNLVVANGNSSYVVSNGVLFTANQKVLVQYPGGLGGSYIVPAGVTNLGPGCFAGSGVTSVGISNNVSVIAAGALASCGRLTNITVSAGNTSFASVNGVLFNAARTALLQFPGGMTGNYRVDTNITAIADLAFAGSLLSSVTVPSSVGAVGTAAFAGCPRLYQANFFGNAPANDGTAFVNSPTTVNYMASASGWTATYGTARTYETPFYIVETGNNTVKVTGCKGTNSFLVIPETIMGATVKSIGEEAFYAQQNLVTLSIPSTVTNIGAGAFADCIRLDRLVFRNRENLHISSAAFAGCLSLKRVDFSFAAPTSIGDYAFQNCTKLQNISFSGVTNIGNYAFHGCTELKFLSLPQVKSIGAYAFFDCFRLIQVTLSASVTSIGSRAFGTDYIWSEHMQIYASGPPPASDGTLFANRKAEIVYEPGTGWGATYHGATTLEIPAGFDYTIGPEGATITGVSYGFSYLVIPSSLYLNSANPNVPVVAIANNAFAGILTITNVVFPNTLRSIGDGAFQDCMYLTSATLPASLTSIGNSAFSNCVKLRGITIPESVTNIGAYAFAGCPGETNLEFGAGLTFLGTNAFAGWTNLQAAYFNGNAPANNAPAFAGNTNAVYALPGSTGWGATYSGRPVAQWTQYIYRTNNGAITLQFYFGNQRVVTVPSVVNGLPVTSLEEMTFADKRNIGSVILPNSITNIGTDSFKYCSLTNIVLSTNLLRIGYRAFYGCALKNVVLPDSLTELEEWVFSLSGLTNVVLPQNLKSIGHYAFYYCPLYRVSLPQTLESIGRSAFSWTRLTNIVLPRSLISIDSEAFRGCKMPGPLLIPPKVTSIGYWAFDSIGTTMGPIYFEGNAPTAWGEEGFVAMNSFTVINGKAYATGPGIAYYDPLTFGWGKTYSGMNTAPWHPFTYTINDGAVTITGFFGSGGALTVPDKIGGLPVTAIGSYAFASNSSLTWITLPDSITSVGDGAFAASTNLAAVEFRGNAPAVGANLFAGDSLNVLRLAATTGWGATLSGSPVVGYTPTGAMTIKINPNSIGAQWQVDGSGPWYPSGATATNLSVGSHTVSFSTVGGSWQTPANITLSVGPFRETTLQAPISYLFIPFSYVTNGTNLTITGYTGSGGTVYIPEKINGMTVSGIAANAFANQSSLTSIVVPDTITTVGTNAFAGCSNLVSVTVGSGITNLSGYVFANCPKLSSVFFNGNAPTTDGTIFNNSPKVASYYRNTATGWTSTFSGRPNSPVPYDFSVLPGNKISISGYSGAGGDVTIPPTIGGFPVTDIYASVFANNLSVTNVTIPDSVVSIQYQAFAGCSNLQTVVLGTNVQWIGDLAFANCTSLDSINFPDSLRIIYSYAFQNNRSLTSVEFGAGLGSIRDSAFASCTNLSQIIFGASLTNIGPGAFSLCRALTNLTFPDSLREIQGSAFAGCSGLTNLNFGTNLSIIGDFVFSSCSGLRDLVLPPNIYLGTNAFAHCTQLQTVLFEGMMQYVVTPYAGAFYNSPSAVVYYPTYAAAGGYWRSPDRAISDYRAAVAYSVGASGMVSIDHHAGSGNFTIPDTLGGLPVASVASDAFADYINVLTIGPGILSIGSMPNPNFGVNTIIVDPANPNYRMVDGVLFDKTLTTLIRCPTFLNAFGSYTVPSTVTTIDDHAFQGCRIAHVTLSANVSSIGDGAFSGAGFLSQLVHPTPDRLTYLGQNAFAGCSSLTNFVTGNNLAQVQPWTFANCALLRSVTLGQSVGSIGVGAFSNCVSLAAIDFPARLASIGHGAFADCQSLATLTIPAGLPTGAGYSSIQLGSGVFAGCTGLTSAYFLGNRPNPDYGNTFAGANQLIVYYLTNSLGWSTAYGGAPTASYAPFGSLQVFFTPVIAGAQWRVDGGPWMSSGAIATNLPVGSHTVSFAAVNNFNYFTPADQVVVVSNMSLTVAAANYAPTPVLYTVTPSNTITITGFRELNADGFLVVPPTINGLPVTAIGDNAFYNNQSLLGVILPPTVTRIGQGSFQDCRNLNFAILSTNLQSIGIYAFWRCTSLKSVVIPDSVTSLGAAAFADCARLTSVQFGGGITTVGHNTFDGAEQLTTLFFNGAPPSDANFLTDYYPQLGWGGFRPAIHYNPAVAGWGSITAGQPTDWASLFMFSTNQDGGITIEGLTNNVTYFPGLIIPPTITGRPVTAIGAGALYIAASEALVLPPTVTSVGAEGFKSCNVSAMFIGASLTNIGDHAFSEISAYGFYVDPANPSYSSAGGILYNKARTELISCPIYWGENMGESDTPLTLTLPNGVERIADGAFRDLQNVSRINLPASLETIGKGAFNGIYHLKLIAVDSANRFYFTSGGALFSHSTNRLIQFFGSQEKYYVPPGVQFIEDGAFMNAWELTEVTIPSTVVSIGAEAFYGQYITSLTVPDTVNHIGAGAFMFASLTNLILPTGLKSIEDLLCYGCEDLARIDIPAGVTNIGDSAFAWSGLAQVELPPGLIHLGAHAFEGTKLTSIVIPDHVAVIPEYAFSTCYDLTNVVFGASVTNIGAYAFSEDRSLLFVKFNDNLIGIESNAFGNCIYIQELIFPATLAYLGDQAFYGLGNQNILFLGDAPAVVGQPFSSHLGMYYTSGRTGWDALRAQYANLNDYFSGFAYATNADGTLTIMGINNVGTPYLLIPTEAHGRQVTGLASAAADGNWKSYLSVTIPATITNIEPGAFIGVSIQRYYAESNNPACKAVDGSLYDSSITRLLGPADLASFHLPATVTNLVPALFDACYNSLAHISVDPANPSFSSVDGVLFDKQAKVLVHYPPGRLALGYSLPESATTIGPNAFMGAALEGIRVPASVTNIQTGSLADLRSIYFEGAAPAFEPNAFSAGSQAMLFYLSPATAADFTFAGVPAGEWLSMFSWVTNGGNSIAVVGYHDFGRNFNYVMFPKTGINGLPVENLGTAFAGARMKGIEIPDGITNLDAGAFYNTEMEEVVIPGTVSAIGSEMFAYCGLYRAVILPGVTSIGDRAFAENYLTSVVIPGTVKTLGYEAFYYTDLEVVHLTNGLLNIGERAFADLYYLEHIVIPNTVTNIGEGAFENGYLTDIVIPPSVVEIKSGAFRDNSLKSVTLSVGLKNIGEEAFYDNSIKTLVIPPGVTNIGNSAFRNNSLNSLTIPAGLESIGSSAFYGNNLETLVFPAGVVSIGDSAFYGNDLESLVISAGVTSIGDSAFRNNWLESVVIPASVTNIGDGAFSDNRITAAYFLGNAPANDNETELTDNWSPYGDTIAYYLAGTIGWGTHYGGVPAVMLTQSASGAVNANNTVTLTNFSGVGSVEVPATVGGLPVTLIGPGAFSAAGNLITSVTLPSGIASIAAGAFVGCPALTTIVIPSTLTNIDVGALALLRGLTNIIVAPDNPVFSSVNGVLFDKNQNTLLAVGGGVTGNFVVPPTVTKIGDDAFLGCDGLTNIVFPPGLVCIADPAFGYCENLTTLTIPASVTFIGDYAFAYCTRLKTVYFQGDAPPDNGTVFVGCSNATVYYLPSAVGFGATFGGAPTVMMQPPVANPVTVYRNPGAAVLISLASLAGHWTNPNQADPVILRSVLTTSTNRVPVVVDADSIFYANTNDVRDQIIYSIADSQNLVGMGVIDIVTSTSLVAYLPPVAADIEAETEAGSVLVLSAAKVLARCLSPDGLALTLPEVSAVSTNGGTVELAGGLISFTPAAGASGVDAFNYTVRDARGGQTTARVIVTVKASGAPSRSLIGLVRSGSQATLHFAGIPGREYLLQTTTNGLPTTNWWNVSTNIAGANGLWNFTDPAATNTLQFYRVRER